MAESPASTARWRDRSARGLVLLAALALALASIGEYRHWLQSRGRLLARLDATGTAARAPGVRFDVAREPDPLRAGLRTARGLLADELDRQWQAGLGPGELATARRDGLDKLRWARATAAAALARRPASWQAAEVLGATRYLEALRRRLPMDPRRQRSWREPLLAAHQLGPGQAEPLRFLAAATLSEWSRLSTEERAQALDLLADAFTDPLTFDLLATSWLRLAPSRATAFTVIPAAPRAWETVKRFYGERADWRPFVIAHERQRDALFARLEDRLGLAEARLQGGDRRRARWYALEVLGQAPPSHRFRPLFAHAVEILPPGPLGEVRSRRMADWLAWSLDHCLLGDCPFPSALLARMAGLAELEERPRLAAAAELGGDPRGAELYARDDQVLTAEWAPYHLLRARRLLAAGDRGGARSSLDRVHADWRSRAAFHRLAAALAAEDGEGLPAAAPPTSRQWPAEAWRQGRLPVIELYPAAVCGGVELEIRGVPAGGSAIEVWWNGELAGAHPVSPGRPVRLRRPLAAARLVRLEIDPLVHPRLRPGAVRLGDCAP